MNEIIAGKNNHRVELLVLQPRSGTNLRDVVQGCTSFLKELEKKKSYKLGGGLHITHHVYSPPVLGYGKEESSPKSCQGKVVAMPICQLLMVTDTLHLGQHHSDVCLYLLVGSL